MRDAWVVAVPSIRPDPFPNVVLEAMSEGRAVVGSRLGGIPEMVMDGDTGLFVEAGDAFALASAMARVLADRDAAAALGEAGYRRLRERFSVDRFAASWREQVANMLDSVGG